MGVWLLFWSPRAALSRTPMVLTAPLELQVIPGLFDPAPPQPRGASGPAILFGTCLGLERASREPHPFAPASPLPRSHPVRASCVPPCPPRPCMRVALTSLTCMDDSPCRLARRAHAQPTLIPVLVRCAHAASPRPSHSPLHNHTYVHVPAHPRLCLHPAVARTLARSQ